MISRALLRNGRHGRKSATFEPVGHRAIAAIQSLCECSRVGGNGAALELPAYHFRTPSPDGRQSIIDLPLVDLWGTRAETGQKRPAMGKALRELANPGLQGFRLARRWPHSTYLSKEVFRWTQKQSVLQLPLFSHSQPAATLWANRCLWAGPSGRAPLPFWRAMSSRGRRSERRATCFTASASRNAAERETQGALTGAGQNNEKQGHERPAQRSLARVFALGRTKEGTDPCSTRY